MKISSRGQYGLRALAVLARRHGNGPTQVREIAREETLSAKYLEQLLGRLRAGGLVKSVRGARGGYQLSREPGTITVREILVVLEGSLAPVSCVDQSGACRDEAACTAHAVWAGLHETVLAYLGSYTLADLVERSPGVAPEAAGSAAEATPEDALESAGARG
jgi:Rrf2 family protein